jgi:hypothetical protein
VVKRRRVAITVREEQTAMQYWVAATIVGHGFAGRVVPSV